MTKKENKYRHSAKDMFNRTDEKSFTRIYPWDRTSSVLTWGVYENKREDELPNKSIKELAEK